MSDEAWSLMWDYVDLVPGEIAVFGYTELEDDGTIYVPEIFLVPQEADASGVDFLDEGLPYAIEKAIAENKLEQLRFCAHSHGSHGAYWSSTDEAMIKTIGAGGTPWFASAIFNKAGATRARVDLFDTPFGRVQVKFDELYIGRDRSPEYEDGLLTEIEHFVKPPKKKAEKKSSSSTSTSGMARPANGDTKGHLTKQALNALTGRDKDAISDGLDFADLEEIAHELGWSSIDDTEGVRWYFDSDDPRCEVQAAALIPTDWQGPQAPGLQIERAPQLEESTTEADERELGVTANS